MYLVNPKLASEAEQADLSLIWSQNPEDRSSCDMAHIFYFSPCSIVLTIWTAAWQKWCVRPAKTQISLGIRPVWSASSLCTQWVAKDPRFLHADGMTLIRLGGCPGWSVFSGCTAPFDGFVMQRLIWEILYNELALYPITKSCDVIKLMSNCNTWDSYGKSISVFFIKLLHEIYEHLCIFQWHCVVQGCPDSSNWPVRWK